jgi:pilus assembly protein CpaE
MSGVNYLPAPNSPEHADAVSPSQAERIIAALRVYYDYVIIDAFSGFNDYTATCIDCASLILFMTNKDIPALRNAKKGLAVIQALSDWEKIRLIIGKDVDGTIKDKDVTRVLSFPIWARIPYEEKIAVNAANQGSPAVLEFPRSKMSQVFSEMAAEIDNMSFSKNDIKQKKSTFWK